MHQGQIEECRQQGCKKSELRITWEEVQFKATDRYGWNHCMAHASFMWEQLRQLKLLMVNNKYLINLYGCC